MKKKKEKIARKELPTERHPVSHASGGKGTPRQRYRLSADQACRLSRRGGKKEKKGGSRFK